MIDQAPIKNLIYDLGTLVTWYQRKTTSAYPTPFLNVFQDIAVGAEYETTFHTKVADQTNLWTNMGSIKMIISPRKGLTIIEKNLGQEFQGDYEGTVPQIYLVKEDDRIIDSDSKEYKVMGYRQEENFRILDLKLL